MQKARVPRDALVLIGDGARALFLRNVGNPLQPSLQVENVFEQTNPASRDQGSDRPGRTFSSVGEGRSAYEQTDWHQLGEDRFTAMIAEALYRMAHENRFNALVVVAPAKVLGNLRKAFHKEVADRITAEVPKDLTSHAIPEIENLLAV